MREGGLDGLPFQLPTSLSDITTCNIHQFLEPEQQGISDCEACYRLSDSNGIQNHNHLVR